MDIRLPDGTLVENLPEGLTEDEIAQLLRINQVAARAEPQQPRPTADDIPGHGRRAPPASQGSGSDWVDGINALGTGLNRGPAYLAGAPVDAAANVRDLGKAAIGSAWQAITGKPAPDALQLTPRDEDVGSGPWLLKQARRTPLGRGLVDPANPAYEGGYLQNTGSALIGALNPGTRGQMVGQMAGQVLNNLASANLAKAVGDATGSPELAIAAGMSPLALKQGLAAGAKIAVRGDEAGRQAMAQRVQDLRNAGVDQPTLGLASGNPVVGAAENLLHSTPFSAPIMERARQRALGGVQDTVERAVAQAGGGGDRGPLNAGTAIQRGVRQFTGDLQARQGLLDEAAAAQGTERGADWAQRVKAAADERTKRLQPFLKPDQAEDTFFAAEKSLANGPTVLQTLKKSLPEGARGEVAGTVIDRLGRAPAGAQGEGSPAWNHETFLARWNAMAPKARDELLSGYPNAARVRADVEAAAQAARRMGDNSKMWSKPSQAWADYVAKGALATAATAAGGLATGAVTPEALARGALATAGTAAAARLAAHALTSPQVVRAAASPTPIDPRQLDAQLRGLAGGGFFSGLQLQPQPQQDEPFGGLFGGAQD